MHVMHLYARYAPVHTPCREHSLLLHGTDVDEKAAIPCLVPGPPSSLSGLQPGPVSLGPQNSIWK